MTNTNLNYLFCRGKAWLSSLQERSGAMHNPERCWETPRYTWYRVSHHFLPNPSTAHYLDQCYRCLHWQGTRNRNGPQGDGDKLPRALLKTQSRRETYTSMNVTFKYPYFFLKQIHSKSCLLNSQTSLH